MRLITRKPDAGSAANGSAEQPQPAAVDSADAISASVETANGPLHTEAGLESSAATSEVNPPIRPPSGESVPPSEPAAGTATSVTTEFVPPTASSPWPAPTPEVARTVPPRICPSCAAMSSAGGEFCPNCGAPFAAVQPRAGVSRRVKVAAAIVAGLLVLGGAGVAVAIKLHHDSQVTAQHRRAAAAAVARQQAAQQAQAQQQVEVVKRQGLESQLQDNITTDATQKANDGLLSNGPATSTTCTPLSGGSSQDVSQSSGTYSCLAAYQTNGDGTATGYAYTGNVNFETATITWRLGGAP